MTESKKKDKKGRKKGNKKGQKEKEADLSAGKVHVGLCVTARPPVPSRPVCVTAERDIGLMSEYQHDREPPPPSDLLKLAARLSHGQVS